MAAPKVKKVNLLIREGFEYSTAGKTLSWLLSAGRAIVIFTELVVIIAFLSRFWLDRQLTDLVEANAAKTSQIQASKTFENDFRSVQTRLTTYQNIDNSKLGSAKLIKQFSGLLPADVQIEQIVASPGKVKLTGITLSEAGLAGFLKAIDSQGNFKNAALTDVSLKTGGQKVIAWEIKLDTVEKKGEKIGTN